MRAIAAPPSVGTVIPQDAKQLMKNLLEFELSRSGNQSFLKNTSFISRLDAQDKAREDIERKLMYFEDYSCTFEGKFRLDRSKEESLMYIVY